MRTVSVRITEHQLSVLEEASKFTGATVSMLVRKGVDLYIDVELPVVMQGYRKKKARKTDTVSAA